MYPPVRSYSGPGTATAATYALVAATAALAALVGVAGALWLRQRQWDAATPPSSEASGSQVGRDRERLDGGDHDDEREEGYEPSVRSGSVLGRCWEWLESAAGASHEAHGSPREDAGHHGDAQHDERHDAEPDKSHSIEHRRMDSILTGSQSRHDSRDSRFGHGLASGSYPTDSGDLASRRQSGGYGWQSNTLRATSQLAQVRDGEEGGLHRGSATTPFTTSSIGSGPTRLSAQAQPSAAPQGGYGAGGSWNAVLGKQQGADAAPPPAIVKRSRSRSCGGGSHQLSGSLSGGGSWPSGGGSNAHRLSGSGCATRTPAGTPVVTPRRDGGIAGGTPPHGSAPAGGGGGGGGGVGGIRNPGSEGAASGGGTTTSSFVGSLRSRASAASGPRGSGSHARGSGSYAGQSRSRSGGTPLATQSASHSSGQPGSGQPGSGHAGSGQTGSGQPGSGHTGSGHRSGGQHSCSWQGASKQAGSGPNGSGQRSGSGALDGQQHASAGSSNASDTSSSAMLLPLHAVVDSIAPGAAARAALNQATRDMAAATTDEETGEVTLASLELYHHKDGTPYMLGAGTFGMVFKARLWGKEEVAVKVFKLAARIKSEAEFRQEVKLLRACASENVAAFRGACLDAPGHLLMVMELLRGGDLRVALANDKTGEFRWYHKARGLDGAPVLGKGKQIALDIARGLAYLHSQHVVHLDLKSPNVLLTKDGRAKIGDVGLARFMPNDYLSTAAAAGTFAWSAPEVLMGKKSSEKADIFSYGVILWEIITGETPHRGRMHALRVPEDCSAGVADLVRQCMEHTPSRRPSAAQVVDLLAGAAAVLDAARSRRSVDGKGSRAPTDIRRELQKRYERCAEVAFGGRVAAHEAGYEPASLDTAIEAIRPEDAAVWSRLITIMRESLASPDIDDPDAEPQRQVYAAILALQTCITLKLQLGPRVLQELRSTNFQELAGQVPQLLPASSGAAAGSGGGGGGGDVGPAAAGEEAAASDSAVPAAAAAAADSDAHQGPAAARARDSGKSGGSGSRKQWHHDAQRCRHIVDAMQLDPQQRKAFAEARQRVGERVHKLRAERRQLLARMRDGASASGVSTSTGSSAVSGAIPGRRKSGDSAMGGAIPTGRKSGDGAAGGGIPSGRRSGDGATGGGIPSGRRSGDRAGISTSSGVAGSRLRMGSGIADGEASGGGKSSELSRRHSAESGTTNAADAGAGVAKMAKTVSSGGGGAMGGGRNAVLSGSGSVSASGSSFAMEATDALHRNMEAESLALQQFQLYLIAELLRPMQHARAEVASWPLLLDAFSTGDTVLDDQRVAEAAAAEAPGPQPDGVAAVAGAAPANAAEAVKAAAAEAPDPQPDDAEAVAGEKHNPAVPANAAEAAEAAAAEAPDPQPDDAEAVAGEKHDPAVPANAAEAAEAAAAEASDSQPDHAAAASTEH